MRPPLVADTGGLLRALALGPDRKAAFPEFEAELRAASGVVVPSAILPEVDYFLRRERPAMRKLVAEILDPATRYELEPILPADMVRALELDAKFASLGLGFVDGSVMAVAERRGILRVLTTDRAHFAAVRLGARYQKALTLVP